MLDSTASPVNKTVIPREVSAPPVATAPRVHLDSSIALEERTTQQRKPRTSALVSLARLLATVLLTHLHRAQVTAMVAGTALVVLTTPNPNQTEAIVFLVIIAPLPLLRCYLANPVTTARPHTCGGPQEVAKPDTTVSLVLTVRTPLMAPLETCALQAHSVRATLQHITTALQVATTC